MYLRQRSHLSGFMVLDIVYRGVSQLVFAEIISLWSDQTTQKYAHNVCRHTKKTIIRDTRFPHGIGSNLLDSLYARDMVNMGSNPTLDLESRKQFRFCFCAKGFDNVWWTYLFMHMQLHPT